MICTRTLKDLYKSFKEFIENHRIKSRQPTHHRSRTYIIMVFNHEQAGGENVQIRIEIFIMGCRGDVHGGRYRSLKRSTTSVPYKQKPTDYFIRRLELVWVVG